MSDNDTKDLESDQLSINPDDIQDAKSIQGTESSVTPEEERKEFLNEKSKKYFFGTKSVRDKFYDNKGKLKNALEIPEGNLPGAQPKLKDNYENNKKYGHEAIKTHNKIEKECKESKLRSVCDDEEEDPNEELELNLEKEKLELKQEKLKQAEQEIHHLKKKFKNTKGKLGEIKAKKDKIIGEKDEKIEKRNKKLGNLKQHITNKLKKYEERRTELRIEIEKEKTDEKGKVKSEKEINQQKLKKHEEELKKINELIDHFGKEEHKIKKHHPSDKYEKKSHFERIRKLANSEYVSLFVFYCAFSLFVFSATAVIALTSKEYQEDNKNYKNYNKFIGISSAIYFGLFILLLTLSFGKEKDLLGKISSFVLLTGAIFVGLFFTYLKINDNFENLTKTEKTNTNLAIIITFGFILYAIYFDLFERRRGTLESDIRIGYLLLSVLLFFAVGGMTTVLTFDSKYNSDEKGIKFLFHLSAGLFIIGCLLSFAGFLSYFPSIDNALGGSLDGILNFIDGFKFKIFILCGFIISIYNTYTLYETYTSPELTNAKLKNSKSDINYRDKWVKNSFHIGVALVSFFLLTLAFCFGGSLKERIFSVFLIFFIVYVGGLLVWLDGEGRINAKGEEEKILKLTEVILGVIAFTAIWYVLFKTKSSKDETLTALSRIIISFSAIIYGLYSSGINIGTLFKLDPGGILKRYLIASLVLGILLFLSFFLLFI